MATPHKERMKFPVLMRLHIQLRNIGKHLRIANATEGHEKEVHLAKARKLADRYNLKMSI